MKERVWYCDWLRFVGILSVILIHILAWFRDYYLHINYKYYFVMSLFDSFTRMGVPIFLMLTGIFMFSSKNNINYKEFIKSKVIVKLVIPFVIISFVYYLYWCGITNNDISIIQFIIKLSNDEIKYHFWFMYEIILIYMMIPFLKVFINNVSRRDLFSLIILIFIFGNGLFTVNLYTSRYDIAMFNSIKFPDIVIYINYLFVGYYLYKYDIKVRDRKIIYILGVISILLIPVADMFFIEGKMNDMMFCPRSIFPFIPSVGLFLFFKYNYDKVKIFKRFEYIIGRGSSLIFYVYMIHVLVMEIVQRIIFSKFIPDKFIESIFLIIVIFLITVLFSYLLSIIIKVTYNYIKCLIFSKT